jgi:hypothetical protein
MTLFTDDLHFELTLEENIESAATITSDVVIVFITAAVLLLLLRVPTSRFRLDHLEAGSTTAAAAHLVTCDAGL